MIDRTKHSVQILIFINRRQKDGEEESISFSDLKMGRRKKAAFRQH